MPNHFLIFTIDELRFALPIEAVRETVRAVAITPLAGAPGVVEGVIDVHGTVTPVLDMRARFRLPPRPVRPSDRMVLARALGRLVALRVDDVLDVATVPDESLSAARDDDPSTRHLAGVAQLPDGLVLVGDLDAFLTQGEREALAVAEEGR